MILDKSQMTEEDIKLQYITPALTSKWDIKKITMESKITDGRINLKGNIAVRDSRAVKNSYDYLERVSVFSSSTC